MAFQDFITNGTYSIIHKVQYDHQNKIINYYITVFTDDSKEEIMATMEKFHDGETVYPSIIAKDINTPPTNPEVGDAYIIGQSPTGDWTSYPGFYTRWYNKWKSIDIIPNVFYDKKDKKYYKKIGDKYKKVKNIFTKDTWNNFLSIEELSKKDNNLIKAIYSYLKTRTEFSGVIDC